MHALAPSWHAGLVPQGKGPGAATKPCWLAKRAPLHAGPRRRGDTPPRARPQPGSLYKVFSTPSSNEYTRPCTASGRPESHACCTTGLVHTLNTCSVCVGEGQKGLPSGAADTAALRRGSAAPQGQRQRRCSRCSCSAGALLAPRWAHSPACTAAQPLVSRSPRLPQPLLPTLPPASRALPNPQPLANLTTRHPPTARANTRAPGA